jgi:hypothetical protein
MIDSMHLLIATLLLCGLPALALVRLLLYPAR